MSVHLKGKKIILAVSGSIAAYKSLYLTRLLVKQGAEVKVLMTKAATEFVSALSFSTLSKNNVYTTIFSEAEWNNHVNLGLWADAMIVAPATANTIAKMAHGIVDNIVLATYLSAKCPVFIAPAMDLDMWKHGSVIKNIALLESYGNKIIPVGNGFLASGLSGDGRLAEPEEILDFLSGELDVNKKDLSDKRILVTAGPTYEDIDPVRYIGNRSTGKMGIALVEECHKRGANVTLIIGPSDQPINLPSTNIIHVRTALQMYEAVLAKYKECDALIMAAAVADYTPKITYKDKFKKSNGDWSLTLDRTHDIAAACGQLKEKHQVNIGFALENKDELENAKAKLEKKNFDFIVLNSLRDEGAGFGYDTNKIRIISKEDILEYPLLSKKILATYIIDALVSKFNQKGS